MLLKVGKRPLKIPHYSVNFPELVSTPACDFADTYFQKVRQTITILRIMIMLRVYYRNEYVHFASSADAIAFINSIRDGDRPDVEQFNGLFWVMV